MGIHKTKRIVIKKADVDELIIPVIEWLNDYSGVITFFSCQGEPTDDLVTDRVDKPYVVFTCLDSVELAEILDMLATVAIVEVSWYRETPMIRYIARFIGQKQLSHFCKWLANNEVLTTRCRQGYLSN